MNFLDQKGIREQVMPQVAVQARLHSELANGLIVGPLDAVVVWNYIARLYTNKVELVSSHDAYPEVSVTVVGLKQSANPKLRDAFLEYCRKPQVLTIFSEHGYKP